MPYRWVNRPNEVTVYEYENTHTVMVDNWEKVWDEPYVQPLPPSAAAASKAEQIGIKYGTRYGEQPRDYAGYGWHNSDSALRMFRQGGRDDWYNLTAGEREICSRAFCKAFDQTSAPIIAVEEVKYQTRDFNKELSALCKPDYSESGWNKKVAELRKKYPKAT